MARGSGLVNIGLGTMYTGMRHTREVEPGFMASKKFIDPYKLGDSVAVPRSPSGSNRLRFATALRGAPERRGGFVRSVAVPRDIIDAVLAEEYDFLQPITAMSTVEIPHSSMFLLRVVDVPIPNTHHQRSYADGHAPSILTLGSGAKSVGNFSIHPDRTGSGRGVKGGGNLVLIPADQQIQLLQQPGPTHPIVKVSALFSPGEGGVLLTHRQYSTLAETA